MNVSVNVTLSAVSGPRFVTITVYDTPWPASTFEVPVFITERSAPKICT